MFATNNVMMVEYWHGNPIPLDVVIPAEAVNELLRIDQAPSRIQVDENSMSFWFGTKRWMRTQLIRGEQWPTHRADEIMAMSDADLVPFSPGFFDAVATLEPFVGERSTVYVSPTGLATERDDGVGAAFELDTGVPGDQAYHIHQLKLLGEVANKIDWKPYPKPCKFKGGDRMRGALVGQRLD
jgi:hypothetical protein